jgi:hypothetical protein
MTSLGSSIEPRDGGTYECSSTVHGRAKPNTPRKLVKKRPAASLSSGPTADHVDVLPWIQQGEHVSQALDQTEAESKALEACHAFEGEYCTCPAVKAPYEELYELILLKQ